MKKFTFCITSKNNKRYLKHAIKYIKKNSSINHDILVFIDDDKDKTSTWCKNNKINYIKNTTGQLYGIGNAYNLLVKNAKTDFVVIYHADMIMGKDFDIELYKLWKPKTVVSATRIEPPLHPSDPSKITQNFGLWPEKNIVDGFKVKDFEKFVKKNKSDKTTKGIFAPWLIHKQDFNAVKGHDPSMKSHSEDRDLFNRFILNGYNLIQSWGAFVYHLTCRGGQFEHAQHTDDLKQKSTQWEILAYNQTREFIRKWGTPPKHNNHQYPIIPPKYDIGIQIKGGNSQLLEVLEPWCSTIFLNDEMQVITTHYIDKEQPNTIINLSDKIKTNPFDIITNEIIVNIDQNTFTQQDFQIIQQLPEIIKDSGGVGKFQLGNLLIDIREMNEYQNNLISL